MYKPTTKIIIAGKKKKFNIHVQTYCRNHHWKSEIYMKKDTVHIIIDDKKLTCIKLPIKSSLMVWNIQVYVIDTAEIIIGCKKYTI